MKNMNAALTTGNVVLADDNCLSAAQTANNLAVDICNNLLENYQFSIKFPKDYNPRKEAYADLMKSAKGLVKVIKSAMLTGLKANLFAAHAAYISEALVKSEDVICRKAGAILAAYGRNALITKGSFADGSVVYSTDFNRKLNTTIGDYLKNL